CACCAGTPDSHYRAEFTRTKGKRVIHVDTRWWDVPYCSDCLEHTRTHRQATLLGGVAVAGYVSGGGTAALLFPLVAARQEIAWVFAALAILSLAFAIPCTVVWKRLSEQARRQLKATCSSAAAAVDYL